MNLACNSHLVFIIAYVRLNYGRMSIMRVPSDLQFYLPPPPPPYSVQCTCPIICQSERKQPGQPSAPTCTRVADLLAVLCNFQTPPFSACLEVHPSHVNGDKKGTRDTPRGLRGFRHKAFHSTVFA